LGDAGAIVHDLFDVLYLLLFLRHAVAGYPQ
jgi:hypothetical protein